jgi:hypothetical protein
VYFSFFLLFLHGEKDERGRMGLSLTLVTVFLIFSFGSSSFFTHLWTTLLLLLSLIACNWSIFLVFQFFILENSLEVFGSLIRRGTQLKEVSSHFVICFVLQVRQLYCRFVDCPLGIPRFFHLAFAIFHWPKPWFMVADWIEATWCTSFGSWVMGIS